VMSVKNYSRISARLYCEPWCIVPATLESMVQQFEAFRVRGAADDGVGPKWRNGWTGEQGYFHPQVEVADGLAVLRVHGILGKHLSALEMECEGYDVGLLEKQVKNIRDDGAVRDVVFDFRTPGGVVTGIESAALAISSLRMAGKRTFAFTSDEMCSAGYWLASACDEIHAEGSAYVGSISTILAGVDSSEMFAKAGLVRKVFATGSLKATGMQGKAWTKEEEDYLWERVRAADGDFKGFVRGRRGLDDGLMQGQAWQAKHAPAGLVDGTSFGSLEDLVEAVYLSR
jgi:ClpP class serine protease